MNKPPMAHRVKKPFKYVSSGETNVALTIRRARAVIEATRRHANNVQPLRKERQAA